ncbi:MAG: hypothetical protein ACPL5I_13865 [Thermodesulfobacteriota bacterium]
MSIMRQFFNIATKLLILMVIPFVLSADILAAEYSQVMGEITLIEELNLVDRLPPSSPPNDNSYYAQNVTGTPYTHKSKKKVTFHICINGDHFLLSDVDHDLKEFQEMDQKSQYLKTDCSARRKRDIRRPGSYTTDAQNIKQIFLPPDKANKLYNLNLTPHLKVIPQEKGKYKIEVSTTYLKAPSGYMKHEIHNICNGKVTGYLNQYLPEDFGKKESGSIHQEEGHMRTIYFVPFKLEMLRGEWQINYDPKGCHGSSVIKSQSAKDPQGRTYELILTAHWTFKPNDPCSHLIEAIKQDLAYAEAYLDQATREKTADPEKYKCFVDRKAYEILHSSPPPRCILECEGMPADCQVKKGEGGVGDEIGVDGDCHLVNEEIYREKARRNCTPNEVVEGILAHEKTHVSQCKGDKARFNAKDTTIRGNMEVAAHLIGIDHMLKSLKRLCPDYDPSLLEEKIKDINRSRLKP